MTQGFDMKRGINRLRSQFVQAAMATPKVSTALAEGPIATRVGMPLDKLTKTFGEELACVLSDPALNTYTPVSGGKIGALDLRPVISGVPQEQIFYSTTSLFSIERAVEKTGRGVLVVDSLDAAKLLYDRGGNEPILIRFPALLGVASGAIVIIPHEDDRLAFRNIEEHVRASIATSTQVLISRAIAGTLSVPGEVPRDLETRVSGKWSTFMGTRYGVQDSQSMVDHGASSALLTAFTHAHNAGRTRFMAPLPHFSPVHGMAQAAHLENYSAVLKTDLSWSDAMKDMVMKAPDLHQTVVVITAPNNPDGTIPDAKELDIFMAWASKNNVQVVGDLTYFGLVYGDQNNYSAVVKSLYEHGAICIFSASKSFSLIGERIAVVSHKDVGTIHELTKTRNTVSGAVGIVSLLRLDHALTDESMAERGEILRDFTADIDTNMTMFRRMIREKGLEDTLVVPECNGGLYVCLQVMGLSTSALAARSKSLSDNPFLLLTEADFGMPSGGSEGGFLRISVSGNPEKKEAAFSQLLDLIQTAKKEA
jgi:aspartate/methionine/tyrosine aminotransferase